jgi:hypothetical protein
MTQPGGRSEVHGLPPLVSIGGRVSPPPVTSSRSVSLLSVKAFFVAAWFAFG